VDLPFEIEVYDKAFVRRGWLGEPMSLSAIARYNAAGTMSFVVPQTHYRFADLMTRGARIVCKYKGEHLMSGLVTGKTDSESETGTFTVLDDFSLLTRILGWPNPTGTIDQQGAETAYDTRTGPAESVVKALAVANATRLGIPLSAAPDLARGATITTTTRMHPLTDRIFPLVDQAGIGLTVQQSGAGVVLDAFVPNVYAPVITAKSGILASWSLEQTPPTATHVVVMGQGEGTARAFVLRVDADAVAEWGPLAISEVARDARDVDDTAPDALAQLQARGDEALAEGAATSGLTVQLAETNRFSYGGIFGLGDRITISVPGLTTQEVVREVGFSYDTDSGLVVTPSVGDPDQSKPERVSAFAIQAIARALRDYDARS
jgi:hypothetical protein